MGEIGRQECYARAGRRRVGSKRDPLTIAPSRSSCKPNWTKNLNTDDLSTTDSERFYKSSSFPVFSPHGPIIFLSICTVSCKMPSKFSILIAAIEPVYVHELGKWLIVVRGEGSSKCNIELVVYDMI